MSLSLRISFHSAPQTLPEVASALSVQEGSIREPMKAPSERGASWGQSRFFLEHKSARPPSYIASMTYSFPELKAPHS